MTPKEAANLAREIHQNSNSNVAEVWIAHVVNPPGLNVFLDKAKDNAVVVVPRPGWYTKTTWYFNPDGWRHHGAEDGFMDPS